MIYVACPYSSNKQDSKAHDEEIEYRMSLVSRLCAKLFFIGKHCVTPLANHYYKDTGIVVPNNYSYWRSFCRDLLRRCDEIYIITAPGWDESIGVKDEIEFSQFLGLTTRYISPAEVLGENFIR